MDYKQYRSWLEGINSTGNQLEQTPEMVTSDARVKKFVVDSVGGDDILRKVMMLNFVTDNIIDKGLADIYIMKRLVNGER